MLLGKLVVFQRDLRTKRASHARFSRTMAKTGNFWFCWRCGFNAVKRVQGLAGRCHRIPQSCGGVLKKLKAGRNPKKRRLVVGVNLAGCVSARGVRGRGPGCDESWVGLV